MKIEKITKEEWEEGMKKENYYHYSSFYMSKEGFFSLIDELKKKHYHIMIYKDHNSLNKMHLKKGKRFSLKESNLEKLFLMEDNGVINFNLSWIDNARSDNFFNCLRDLSMKMVLLGENGGWDATPIYLVGRIKEDVVIKQFYEMEKNRNAYFQLKRINDERHEFYEKKKNLEIIEELLLKLGIPINNLIEYIVKPNEFLFKKTIIESVLVDQAGGYINWLKARTGDSSSVEC